MKLSRFVRNERGAALVEMALVLPIVILLFLGMIDFGRAIFLYNNLTNAAREGARYGAALSNPTSAPIEAWANGRAQDFTGNPAATGAVATVQSDRIIVAFTDYSFTPITPLPMVQTLKISVRAVFRREGIPSP